MYKETDSLMMELDNGCKGLKLLCTGFSLVDELYLTYHQLKAEAKLIINISARSAAQKITDDVQLMIDRYSAVVRAP